MAAHLYWRVRFLSHSGQCGMNEIEMATTTGGTNLCTGGTPYTNTSYGGYYGVDKAFNGDYTSGPGEWAGSSSRGYAGYQFAAPVEINEFRLQPFSDNSLSVGFFAFESSDDDVTYTIEWYGFRASGMWAGLTSFARPVVQASNRWWGIYNKTSHGDPTGGSYWDLVIKEWEMRTVSGGADVTGSGTAYAFPINGSYPPSQAFDDNMGTVYYSNNAGDPATVIYDLGSAMEIVEHFITGDTASGNIFRAPGTGLLLYSQDGKAWLSAGDYTDQPYTGAEATYTIGLGGGGAAPRRRMIVVT